MWVLFFHIFLLALSPLGEAFCVPGSSLRPLLKLHAQPTLTPLHEEASLWTRLTTPLPADIHSFEPDTARLRNWIVTHPNPHWESLQISPDDVTPKNAHLSLPPVDPCSTPIVVRQVTASIHQYNHYLHYVPLIVLIVVILDLMFLNKNDADDFGLDNVGVVAMMRSEITAKNLIRIGVVVGLAILWAMVVPR